MLPLPIGAALTVADLPAHRRWLIDGQRDLELQDFFETSLLLGDWQARVSEARRQLDGFAGRLGIHGPYFHVPITCNDPEIMPIVTRRFQTGLDAAIALGATQMVVHAPFTIWDHLNFCDHPGTDATPSLRDSLIAACHDVMRPVVARAEDHGVTLVLENCDEIDPQDAHDLATSFGSAAVRLSVDTGHAYNSHMAHGAPPVAAFVTHAGGLLEHVHLQDTDGRVDRHWPPGKGGIDWPPVFEALAALPQRPHLVLELRHHTDLPQGFAHLKALGLAV